jgi:two-component system chemotaxis response regulator CheB
LSAEVDSTISLFPMASPRHFQLAADQLLASIACSYRHRALALVLSGTGRGGSLGVQEVKQQGGMVFAQDEASSLHWDMPKAAIETGCVDSVLPLPLIAPALVSTVMKNTHLQNFGERS